MPPALVQLTATMAMTDVEEIEHEIELLQQRKRKAPRPPNRGRGARRRPSLAGDESLPVRQILARVFGGWSADQERALIDDDAGGAGRGRQLLAAPSASVRCSVSRPAPLPL